MNSRFTLYWRKNGAESHKKIEKREFGDIMESLKVGFHEDNEISTRILEVLPQITSMRIDFDYNESQDVPIVQYTTREGKGAIKVIRHHKVIWSILDRYCE